MESDKLIIDDPLYLDNICFKCKKEWLNELKDTQLEFLYKIDVIKVINPKHDIRADRIYSATFGRVAAMYEKMGVTFIEKNTIDNEDFIEKYKINSFPSTLIFRNDRLVKTVRGILPTIEVVKLIKKVQYL
tara:strand:+ start:140 stop:532 length:393 start_codon:yes stop_codon:yes gene_type:complete